MSPLRSAQRAALCLAVVALALAASAPRSAAQAVSGHSSQGASSAHQQEIQEHLRKAGQYLQSNQPALAIPEFKAIVALDPKNVDALGNLGVIYFFANDYAS